MRGTPKKHPKLKHDSRITPACAGNTFKIGSRQHRAWDHPRVCGEHYTKVLNPVSTPGSPPRVRGTLLKGCIMDICDMDHPRVCGEHIPVLGRIAGRSGSPPRVRGTRLVKRRLFRRSRITPACAGNT